MRHSAQEDQVGHHAINLIGIQAKRCYAMPAPNGSIRANKSVFVKTMEILEKKGKERQRTQMREYSV